MTGLSQSDAIRRAHAIRPAFPPFKRPTQATDPSECVWCCEEAFGDPPCPYHGEDRHAPAERRELENERPEL